MNTHFLTLALNSNINPAELKALEEFQPLEAYFKETHASLKALGLSKPMCDAITNPNKAVVDESLRWRENDYHHLITWHDKRYPERLKEIDAAPPLLFVKGKADTLLKPQLAIVGSRQGSLQGLDNAKLFAANLSRELVITSGLALGIDGKAHLGALEASGETIAVMATGIDRIYPTRHRRLADAIIENGALVSEFPLKTRPMAYHFPRRNRIISGLSLGVLVVEAKLKSGTLITARLASEQGREVFAIPSSIHSPHAKGCHYLIQQGAKLVEKQEDILEELKIYPPETQLNKKILIKTLDKPLQNLVKFVGYEVTSVSTICTNSGITLEKIADYLSELEINGVIKAVPGGYQRLV